MRKKGAAYPERIAFTAPIISEISDSAREPRPAPAGRERRRTGKGKEGAGEKRTLSSPLFPSPFRPPRSLEKEVSLGYDKNIVGNRSPKVKSDPDRGKPMTNEILEAMKRRRSVRAYKPEQITAEQLDAVLEAGTFAASGMNMQPVKLVEIQDEPTRKILSRLNAQVMGTDADPFYGAPTFVAVFADKARSTYLEDGSLAIGNMMLAAYSIGLGSCWIHRAREVFSMPEGKELMKKWGIPENFAGIGHCALGYAADPLPPIKPRKPGMIIKPGE